MCSSKNAYNTLVASIFCNILNIHHCFLRWGSEHLAVEGHLVSVEGNYVFTWKFRKCVSPSFCYPVSVSKHSLDTSRQATWQLFFISADWGWLWYIFGGAVIMSWYNFMVLFYRIYTSEYVWSIIWLWICLISWDFITYFYNTVWSSGSEDSTKLFQISTASSRSALRLHFIPSRNSMTSDINTKSSFYHTLAHGTPPLSFSCHLRHRPILMTPFGVKGKRKDHGLKKAVSNSSDENM